MPPPDAAVSLPPAPERTFASDNSAGALPEVLDALVAANDGHAFAYGADPWTERAVERVRGVFGVPAEVAFCWGGTGANVVGLQALLRPGEAVVCAQSAHIAADECGAPERFLGAKLIDLPTEDGKLTPEAVRSTFSLLHDEHHVQPKVVSITQSTELGTVYSADEVAALAELARAHDLYVHLDGARLGNAGAALGGTVDAVRSFTVEAGIDVLTLGGTKAGMTHGEAVVFLKPELGARVRFIRKQAAQLASKMRFIAAQMEALLEGDRWLLAAAHANAMAALLADEVRQIPGVTVNQDVQVNAVFASLPAEAIEPLQAWSPFWTWDDTKHEVRWMTSWDTTEEDVRRFAAGIRSATAQIG
jgi:threonine aldolase